MLRLCCEMVPSMSWPKIKYSLDLSSIRALLTRVDSQLISKSLLIMLVVVAFLILFILSDGFLVLHYTSLPKDKRLAITKWRSRSMQILSDMAITIKNKRKLGLDSEVFHVPITFCRWRVVLVLVVALYDINVQNHATYT